MKILKRKLVCAGLLLVLPLLGFVLVFHPDRPLWMINEPFSVAASDGVLLSGTLSRPRWRKPIGAVVVVHGSGPLTRGHVRGDVRALVAQGFAVVHYDKRGAGDSQGEYMPSSSHSMSRIVAILADDAVAMMTSLQKRFEHHALACGFFGASQAGWIIPLAISQCRARPTFAVIISGTPASTGLEGYYSLLSGDGTSAPQVQDPNELVRRTRAFDGDPGFDPLPLWEALDCPTLWLLGDADRSVPTFVSVDILEKLRRAGHAEHTIVRYAKGGHDLRDVETGQAADIWPTLGEWYRTRIPR